jgi:hypothetical protein
MYNKLSSKSNTSKFGSQHISSATGLTPVMEAGLTSAIPIWELLKITEEQYDLLYKTPIIEKKDE